MTTANGSTTLNELLDAGEKLISDGKPILPCNGKRPCNDQGRPADDWHNLPISFERLEVGLVNAKEPTIGMIMGPKSGVIDIETDDDGEVEAVRQLFFGCDPVVTVAYHSKRGRHDWFQYDERLKPIGKAVFTYKAPDGNSVKIRLGVNNGGAQSIIPPSANRQWLPGLSPDDCNVEPLPEVVIERLLVAATPAAAAKAASSCSHNGDGVDSSALASMLSITKNMEDGGDGSKRLFTVACRAVEFNLSDIVAVATIRAYAAERPFPKAWSDAEIVQRIRDAEGVAERGREVVIANFEEVDIVDPATGDTKTVKVPLPMTDVIAEVTKHSNDWPRRVDNVLFVDDKTHGIGWFDRRGPQGLFGWLHRRFQVDWACGGKFVSRGELFAELERTATKYDAIELLPHEPMVNGLYYRGKPPKPGDGRHLRWLLDRFCPETTVDGDLIKAAMMTAAWGGPCGRRPAFVITSDHGRGAGKSTLAELIGRLFDGAIDVSAGENIETLKTRLLSPEAMTKRIAFLDNVKTLKLSWAELESLITTPMISGKRMYVGEGQRPNLLTWFITLNGVSLATDMAQRSVIIKLDRAATSGDWYDDTTNYIDEHRNEIIGDLIAELRSEPYPLAEFSRWATWERDILQRLPEPGEAQRLILERQAESNCESDEAEIIEVFFAEKLRWLKYNPTTDQVAIPVATAAMWLGWAINDNIKTGAASRRISQMINEAQIKRLSADRSRTYGRNFIWAGEAADVVGDQIRRDLPERLAQRASEGNQESNWKDS